MKVLGTGLSGLVGSKFVDLYRDSIEFQNLDLSSGVDILNESQVNAAFEASEATAVIHFAAFTDTQKAFEQQGDKEGPAYKVNVLGTRNIALAAKKTGKYLIHISTAYVFDGTKVGKYTETDEKHPIEWYGQTKAWAEDEVEHICPHYSILRIDRPYRLDEFPKLDLLHKVKKQLEEGSLPPQFADTFWTPTSIEEFSKLLAWISQYQPDGIFHTTTEPEYSDFTFAQWVNEYYGINGRVEQGSLTEYLKTHPRPYHRNTSLDTSKIRALIQDSANKI
jgi:dTDP-4-dehydrorhamnose reductase